MRDLKKGDSAAEENLLKIDDSFEHFNEIFNETFSFSEGHF